LPKLWTFVEGHYKLGERGIDYRCADEKKNWRVKRRHRWHSIGLDSLFQKTLMFTPKKVTVEPGDAFKNPASELVFENVKGCREAALHIFVKQIPPTDSWHQVDSDRCNFHPLMPALTLVSLLERSLVLETAICRVATSENDRLHIYSLWKEGAH
jgi:hypothetical protein